MNTEYPQALTGRVLEAARIAAFAVVPQLVAAGPLPAEQPAIPKIASGWWTIAGNPDLGKLNSDRQQPVDFGIWRAADGTWQLWSCIRHTKENGQTRLFYRWEGKKLTQADWKPMGIAMRADTRFGETPGGLQAPFVVQHEKIWHMFYGDWENICLATSRDSKSFRRASIGGAGPQLFGEGKQNKTRDPMLLKIDDTWHCYYCAMTGEGGIFVRRSMSLTDWTQSQPRKVCSGGSPGKRWWNAECPHVVRHDGYYYLLRTSKYKDKPRTTVYASSDPLNFGVDDDTKIVAALPVAAPEVVFHEGDCFLAALKPQLDGIRMARLKFVSPSSTSKPP